MTKVTVLEMHDRPNWWRVWVNHKPVSPPIHLPESHDRWSPIATAESWDGGTGGTCNTFLYRFRHVSIAHAPGGGWHQLTGGYPIQQRRDPHPAGARFRRLPRGGRPAGLPAPRRYFLIQIGVPSGASVLELPRRRVRDAHAAVRDGLAEQLRHARAVDADDAAARPLGELRVGARLDGEDAEERVVVRDEAGRDVVVADRRLPAGRADRDDPVPLVLAEPVDVDRAAAAG